MGEGRAVRPDGRYEDDVAAILAGAEERLKKPLKTDSIEELGAMLMDARAQSENPPRISRNVAELLGIPLDDPDVEPETGSISPTATEEN